jgi:hypothetical protein
MNALVDGTTRQTCNYVDLTTATDVDCKSQSQSEHIIETVNSTGGDIHLEYNMIDLVQG